MADMRKTKTPMPTRAPEERRRDFYEVTLGYTAEMAISEAQRCLHCANAPCVTGCPVGISIPNFIEKVKTGEFEAAYKIITESSTLPAVCGRVCPQETQCESKCVRGKNGEPVGIGYLERFVADEHMKNGNNADETIPSNGKKVAVIGSGPSGLTCAGDLRKKGYDVTVFEALHTEGGVLSYGIPEFRLPKSIVRREVSNLASLGVKIEKNTVIGRTVTVDELFEDGFEAVYIGSGAGLPSFMQIPGEQYKGVYSANEFLTRVNLMKAYKEGSATPIVKGGKVAVVGGGNVAMDAARTALRLGAEKVYIIYRRSMEELPSRKEEVEHAMEEGVDFRLLQNPVAILGYDSKEDGEKFGWVKSLRVIKMELGEPDEKGRRRPIEIQGSEFEIEVDTVIIAIGNTPNPLVSSTTEGLEVNRRGGLVVKEGTTMTTREGVFAGGDAVTGAATVILAMGAGKQAAKEIDEYLKNRKS